jgi:hypothetical protein
MKKFISAIAMFTSIHAGAASSVTQRFTFDQLSTNQRCSLNACKGDDNGKSFLRHCEMNDSQFPRSEVTVSVLSNDANQKCYCPCTLGFEIEIRESNLNGTN